MRLLVYIFLFTLPLKFLSQEEKFKSLFSKAREELNNFELDSALFYANTLLVEAEKNGSEKYIARAHAVIGRVYDKKNNSKEALIRYFKALKLSKKNKDFKYEAYILNSLGVLYFNQKSYTEASRFMEEELALKERMGDSSHLSNSLTNFSLLYNSIKEFEKAAVLLLKARKIVYIKKDPVLLGRYFDANAFYYYSLFLAKNKINQTEFFKNEQIDFKSDKNSLFLADSAELYWEKSISIWLQNPNKGSAIEPLYNLGAIYNIRGEYESALKSHLKIKSILDTINPPKPKFSLEVIRNIAFIYSELNDFKNANEYFVKTIALSDSLNEDEIIGFNKKLAKQYELETNTTINKQETELNLKNSQIAGQQKRNYIYILLFVILVLIIMVILFFLNFNRRLARKIEEAKEKFFTNIMHEIRTPLSMIQAPLKTLKPRLDDDESKHYIELAEKNVVRLNELINQMLDVSKIENSLYKLNKTVGDLPSFINEIISNYKKQAVEKNINFVTEINLKSSLLVFDKDALEKIITNLLSNAIKYTPTNGTVGLNMSIDDLIEEAKLVIEVWDTGIGIAKKDQDKIFGRFFRSEKSINKASGVGIGLSLVKDLIDAHKGKISFLSEENKGTKFTLEIALKYPEQIQSTIEINNDNTKPIILLIEDDKDIIDFVGHFLQSKDMIVLKASNGAIAKTVLNNISPDLIVTDLMMDELDGLSFIKEIKLNKNLSHIPVIVLSAKSSAQTRMEVLNSGVQAFLSKPFLPEELFSVIKNQLELIAKFKAELKSKIVSQKPELTIEEKFSSTEPYTQKLFDLIFANLDNSDLTVELLADMMATNRSHFQRKVKSLTDFSPSEIIKLIRLEKGKEFLLAKKGNITEVAYMCGFSSQSYFTKCFTQQFGYNPTQVFDKK